MARVRWAMPSWTRQPAIPTSPPTCCAGAEPPRSADAANGGAAGITDLEVADIFRDHGAAWREANRGHLSLGQLKVMSAIERCRTSSRPSRWPACSASRRRRWTRS
jgi:hypothetical protein